MQGHIACSCLRCVISISWRYVFDRDYDNRIVLLGLHDFSEKPLTVDFQSPDGIISFSLCDLGGKIPVGAAMSSGVEKWSIKLTIAIALAG